MCDTFKLKTSTGAYKSKTLRTKVCACKKSKPAKTFDELVDLVKQAEEVLIKNGYGDVGDRISILRGIYYGTAWSLDYNIEKSIARNIAFNLLYTGSNVVADARKKLKCCKGCIADLFNSLYKSPEVFHTRYKAVDFGHLIIGIDARRSWRARNVNIPTQGGSGLEICTWVGDLGGGVGKLSLDRVKNPSKRAKILFLTHGSSYGAMVNLEGDIAAYVVGMNKSKESNIENPTNIFNTIHESLKDYFDIKWDKRAYFFLKMLGGKFTSGSLTNKNELIEYCAEAFRDFANWYMGLRMKEKGMGNIDDFLKATDYFIPVSKEVASIFIDGLLHVILHPQDMITARTDPKPLPKEKSSLNQAKDGVEKTGRKLKDTYEDVEDWWEKVDLNPFD